MASPRLLISGDYWHADFRDLLARMSVPVTLTPLGQLETTDTQRFNLVVIAQSRSNQYDQAEIDAIVTNSPLTPVIMLLGSWCEGERRSDLPVTGVKRVFWHQWQGRFDDFSDQLDKQGISLWHAPAIETDADRAKAANSSLGLSDAPVIGISAVNQQTFESLGQAISALGGKPKWVERTSMINLCASATTICIDADSADETLDRRIEWVRKQVAHVPLIVLMNFPRRQEIEQLQQSGVASVISKPFELIDLQKAIETTVDHETIPKATLKGPSFAKRRSSTNQVE